jgi:tRNA dimethylallyltransferase
VSASSHPAEDAGHVVVIVGATGTGKSDLSLRLAQLSAEAGTEAEIVNADAMQLYRGMDVGTAKLSPEERLGIPHHLLDVLDVTEDSSVADYQREARTAIDDILFRGKLPILVGGSGLYVSSVIYDFQFPGTDNEVRARLEAELDAGGPGLLYQRLKAFDPAAALSIGATNGRRIVRALEVIELTGSPVSGTLPEAPVPWRPATVLGLGMPRERLIPRLDLRVRRMWRDGLVEEVAALLPLGLERGVTASRAIGYAQALAQLRGTASAEQAIEQTQALTRRYSRRQVSWFRRYPGLVWLDAEDSAVAERAAEHALGLGHGD